MTDSTTLLFSLKLKSLFCIAALLAIVSAGDSNQQQPLVNDIRNAQTTANPSVVDHYKQEFEEWSFSRQFRTRTVNTWCSGCDQAPECCPMGGWFAIPGPSTTSQMVSTSAQANTTITASITAQPSGCPLDCSATSTPNLPAPTSWDTIALPVTIQSSMPAHKTIFRVPQSATPSDNPVQPAPAPVLLAQTSNLEPKDITSTYYTFTLEGHHPFTIPLILQDQSKTPTTILATANTQLLHSFISASLLRDLNLTSLIQPLPPLSPSQQSSLTTLTRYLGTPLSLHGSISIDLLAGKHDRRLPNEPFLVFDFRPASDLSSPLRVDTVVGIEFLDRAHALRLSDEYVGVDVGVREGLGVVVQRVYDRAEIEERSEL